MLNTPSILKLSWKEGKNMTIQESLKILNNWLENEMSLFNFSEDQRFVISLIHDNAYLHGMSEGLEIGQEVIDTFIGNKTKNLKKEKEEKMGGCFGNNPIDKYLESQVDEYNGGKIHNKKHCSYYGECARPRKQISLEEILDDLEEEEDFNNEK